MCTAGGMSSEWPDCVWQHLAIYRFLGQSSRWVSSPDRCIRHWCFLNNDDPWKGIFRLLNILIRIIYLAASAAGKSIPLKSAVDWYRSSEGLDDFLNPPNVSFRYWLFNPSKQWESSHKSFLSVRGTHFVYAPQLIFSLNLGSSEYFQLHIKSHPRITFLWYWNFKTMSHKCWCIKTFIYWHCLGRWDTTHVI